MIGSSGSRISSRCSASQSLCEVVELGGIADQHLFAFVLGDALEASLDRLAAFRPRGRALRKVRAPEKTLEARVLAALQPSRVVPTDHVALSFEKRRRQNIVAFGVQALALELVVRKLELVGAPRERCFGEDHFQLRKTLE